MASKFEELKREIAELEREMERVGASARDAEAALASLEDQRAEAAGRLQLARRAVADFETRISERRDALEEARKEAASAAFKDSVRRRDAVAGRVAERLDAAVADLEELDRAREEVHAAHQELLEVANGIAPTELPGEPEELQEQWERLAAHVRRGLNEQLEDELVEAAARSPMGAAIGDLPRHLQEAARRRRQQLIRAAR